MLEALFQAQKSLGWHLSYWLALCMATLAVFVLAAISWKCVEYPLIRLGRRLAVQGAALPQEARA